MEITGVRPSKPAYQGNNFLKGWAGQREGATDTTCGAPGLSYFGRALWAPVPSSPINTLAICEQGSPSPTPVPDLRIGSAEETTAMSMVRWICPGVSDVTTLRSSLEYCPPASASGIDLSGGRGTTAGDCRDRARKRDQRCSY